jgi:N-acetylglucosaminyldiphosphoundecaprenol N-acetyl-beta-D-mannosaminyltransferase
VSLSARRVGFVLDIPLDVTSDGTSCERIFSLVQQQENAYVCYATAHMLIEANRRSDVCQAYRDAAIVNPDGKPLAWGLQILGYRDACCVSGPNHTPRLLREAESRGIPVGFYGGRPETLELLKNVLIEKYPELKVSFVFSPPFRELTQTENEEIVEAIQASGTRMLFVGLGSIKQELWMRENYASIPCVCLGVGAVFEFLSGEKTLPPQWAQRMGLAWLARLCQEPRRLFRRNLYSPIFVAMFALQVVTELCWRVVGISRSDSALVGRKML